MFFDCFEVICVLRRNRDIIDSVSFSNVGSELLFESGTKFGTGDIDDDVGLISFFCRYCIPFVGKIASIHEKIYVGVSEFFYFLYGLEIAKVEVSGMVEEKVEE
jgi:hypothetical protein